MDEQKTLEHKINQSLSGGTLQNALNFVSFLRENELTLEQPDEGWAIMNNGEWMGYIDFHISPWTLFIDGHGGFDMNSAIDNTLKETTWANVNHCSQCSGCDDLGLRVTIFDRDFEGLCLLPLKFTNPDTATLENIKKLMLLLKQNRT